MAINTSEISFYSTFVLISGTLIFLEISSMLTFLLMLLNFVLTLLIFRTINIKNLTKNDFTSILTGLAPLFMGVSVLLKTMNVTFEYDLFTFSLMLASIMLISMSPFVRNVVKKIFR